MLVAVTSFVLHSGAMAGVHARGIVSHQSSAATHIGACRQSQSENGDRITHVRAPDACAHMMADSDHESAGGTHKPHCSTVCGLVLPSIGLGAVAAPVIAVTLALMSQHGSGLDPDSLQRPPRTPCIA